MTHVGRYAPSPSGPLHVGQRAHRAARVALGAQRGRALPAAHRGSRSGPLATAARSSASSRTSRRSASTGTATRSGSRSAATLYARALEQLEAAGRVYPCFCTRADVRAATVAPHGDGGAAYPGTCRELRTGRGRSAPRERAERASLRFRSEDGSDDYVLRRSDGFVGYQLAVVVDDAAQGVNHVLRGDDLAVVDAEADRALARARPRPAAALPARPARARPRRHGASASATGRSRCDRCSTPAARPNELVGWLAWSAGIVESPAPVRARDLSGRSARTR